MTLTLVTNSSLTIEGRPERDNEKNCPSLPLKKLRSYFVFQSLKASLTNVKFGYYLAVSASGILTSNTCLFFFCSCFCCNIFNFLAALSCEDKRQPDMEALRVWPLNFSFSDTRKCFITTIIELFSLLSPKKIIRFHRSIFHWNFSVTSLFFFYLCFCFYLSSVVFMNSDTIGILYLFLDKSLLLHLIIIKLRTLHTWTGVPST